MGWCAMLLHDPQYSDAKILCGDKEWKVHRVVLCMQSKYFAAAFNGNWEEAKSGEISLHDHEVDAVDSVLQYLYKADYNVDKDCSGRPRDIPRALHHVQVHILADKLQMSHLASLAAIQFKFAILETDWKSSSFVQAIRELYENASDHRMMRSAAVEASAKHGRALLTEDYGAEFRQLIDDVPSFGTEFQIMALRQAKEYMEGSTRYWCQHRCRVLRILQGDDEGNCPYCWMPVPGARHNKVEGEIELEVA